MEQKSSDKFNPGCLCLTSAVLRLEGSTRKGRAYMYLLVWLQAVVLPVVLTLLAQRNAGAKPAWHALYNLGS